MQRCSSNCRNTLSSTSAKDLNEKYHLYEEHSVQEYWVIYPGENVLEIYDLHEENKHISRGKFVRENVATSRAIRGLKINLKDVFEIQH